jgi:catechol 2,3-dioxygenase-like lactoylglutathione lyase family enzyme
MIRSFAKMSLVVHDIGRSLDFYSRLGLTLAAYRTADNPQAYQAIESHNRTGAKLQDVVGEWTRALFWFDEERTHCFYLMKSAENRPFCPQHIGFDVDLAGLRRAHEWLRSRGVEPGKDFGKEPLEPIVHNWIPSASLSFADPDGHHVELHARLPGEAIPDEHLPPQDQQPLYLSEWERLRATIDRRAR